MLNSKYNRLITGALVFLGLLAPLPAVVTVSFVEDGSDVVASYTGTLDLAGLVRNGNVFGGAGNGFIIPGSSVFFVAGDSDFYSGLTMPSPFGTGSFASATTVSGDVFAVGNIDGLNVPLNYVSGSTLTGSMTFANATFTSLGLTPGSYVYTWASDSVVLNIQAIPEPAAYASLFGVGVLGLALLRRRGRPGRRGLC